MLVKKFEESKRGLSPEEVLWKLLCEVKRRRGVLVLLWHSAFGRRNVRGYHNVFAEFIRKAPEEGAYAGLARETIDGACGTLLNRFPNSQGI